MKDKTRRSFELQKGPVQLLPVSHQRIEMLERTTHVELRTSRFCDRIQRFTRGVRNQVEMKIDGNAAVLALTHLRIFL
jgi:hypothetical protein